MSSSYIIFFSSTLLIHTHTHTHTHTHIYIYIYVLCFFMCFLKSNFRTSTIKLFLAVFYKIKKLVIIEIILLNVTHISLIFFYCLVIYIYIYLYLYISIIPSNGPSDSLIFFGLLENLISKFL